MLLEAKHISKQFNGIYALKNVDFQIKAGEIHGLVGENGAGKSTLIKILTGVYSLDEGDIRFDGQLLKARNPGESRAAGINVIHQNRSLIPSFNGIENAYLGLPYEKKGLRVDWKKMEKRVSEKADELGVEIDLKIPSARLSPPAKTILEIIRAMMTECRLLILDEPTASLTDKEAELLFRVIGQLKKKGSAILYVTHRMEEIFRLTDQVTVMKNGQIVDTVLTGDVDREQLISMMTDNWTSQVIEHREVSGEILFEAEDIVSKDGTVREASFSVHRGEILGIFGLAGSGRTELLECVYGCRPVKSGRVLVKGTVQEKLSPAGSIENGVSLICEERRGKAIIETMNVKENVVMSTIDHYASLAVVNEKLEIKDTEEKVAALDIKIAGVKQPLAQLSGGNQQKVVFAKAMMTRPDIFLCDEPTQAVDVKTRQEIHMLLRSHADQGGAVVYVSSDLKELLEVSDTIAVMARGRIRHHLANKDLTANQVLACCYED